LLDRNKYIPVRLRKSQIKSSDMAEIRLLFLLTSGAAGEMPGRGGVLLVTRVTGERFDARFLFPAAFITCIGASDNETEMKLAEAFKRNDSAGVLSLRRETPPDDTCWCSG
jgi:hypothetical protein